jgi:hypothetical protein
LRFFCLLGVALWFYRTKGEPEALVFLGKPGVAKSTCGLLASPEALVFLGKPGLWVFRRFWSLDAFGL